MKLSSRLSIVLICVVCGLLLIAGFGLHTLRATMIEDKQAQIRAVISLAAKQVEYYQAQAQSGKLSQEEAQARAAEALNGLHNGDDYIFARRADNYVLAHGDARKIGKVDAGTRLPDGRTNLQSYQDALRNGDFAILESAMNHPNSNVPVPKLNAIMRIPSWGWTIGYGVFIDSLDQAYWRFALHFLLIGGAVLAVVLVLAYVMGRTIYTRLGGEPAYAAEAALRIAGGDLSHTIMVGGEQDSLLGAVARMQGNLQSVIERIRIGTTVVGQATANLRGRMEQISEATRASSDSAAATVTVLEEMSVSVARISTNARETEMTSRCCSELAARGEHLINQAAGEIQRVSGQMHEASELIGGLAQRAKEIDGIATLIKEIADQTGLLALNAAIEAARAGEQGRGFAVVADEVRKLAERTTHATGQITDMIKHVQIDTGSVVSSMQAVTPLVSNGVSLANAAAGALREINASIVVTLDKIRDVASTTSQQSAASSSVASNVERIAHMTEDAASAVLTANQEVRSLELLANDLREHVTYFRLQ